MSVAPPIPEELWARVPPEVQVALLEAQAALLEVQAAQFEGMQKQIERLEAEILELKARLNQTSANSSKPPSSDPPHAKPAPPKSPSRKRRGGQKGHPRHVRELVPPEKVAERVECKPEACRRCGKPLEGEDPDPIRHQVAEVPPIEPVVVEYRCHRLECPGCGTTTCAPLPKGVPTGAFGPRLLAFICLLTGAYRLGKRKAQQLLSDTFGLKISLGSISKAERLGAEALLEADAEARASVKAAEVVHVDETSWREGEAKSWLWTGVGPDATVFYIAPTRGAAALYEVVGECPAMVVVSDRYSAYSRVEHRQICWAHLRRDFQAMVDRDAGGKEVGEYLLERSKQIFELWERYQSELITEGTFRKTTVWLRRVVRGLLERGLLCGCAWTATTCKSLLAIEEHLWTFASVDGVAPDNNAAERALRHAVIWRKTSGGTKSASGSRFVERVLTVVETCRRRGRDVFTFLTACVKAKVEEKPSPSLLSEALPP